MNMLKVFYSNTKYKPMNIALFINSLSNSGGTERVSTLLANHLAQNNKVFFISRLKSNPFFELDDRIKYLYLGKENENIFLNYAKYLYKVSSIIKEYHINIWIDVSTSLSLISIPCKLLCKFDVLAWEHFNLTWEWNWFTAKISRYLACHYAKNVIVLTKTDSIRYKEKFGTSNIICIPNPVTIAHVDRNVDEKKIVLSVGRHTYQKGQDMMLDMWAKTQCRNKGWKLRIVGGGELEEELNERILQLGVGETVEMIPATKEMEKLYSEADIFILSSRWEGLPLALIEAISVGLPVVSFNCETGPRDVVVDSYNGYLIDCFDVDNFAQKIDELSENKELRMKFSSNSLIKSKDFSPIAFYDNWNRLLR